MQIVIFTEFWFRANVFVQIVKYTEKMIYNLKKIIIVAFQNLNLDKRHTQEHRRFLSIVSCL